MKYIFLQLFSDFLEVAVIKISLWYCHLSLPHEWLHYQNLYFLTLGQGNGTTPWNYAQICWTVFQYLVELSVPYCIDFLVCFLLVVIDAAYSASPGITFLFAKTVSFSGWLLTTTWEWQAQFGITDWFLQKFGSSGRVENSFSVADWSMQ